MQHRRPDVLSEVARELSALSHGDRRMILAALNPIEREKLRLASNRAAPIEIDRNVGHHSTWMVGLRDAAREGRDARMTVAAKGALLAALSQSAPPERPAGRSLLQAAGGLLSQAKVR